MPGPLAGLKVIELGGMGPGPFASMLFADMGADVVKIDRVGGGMHMFDSPEARRLDVLSRGRRSISLNLKDERAVEILLDLVAESDVLIEGLRPGVTERLGVGPDACHERNPRLVYGRMTGWGQDGPLAAAAGHDLNYLALSGVLDTIGRAGEAPTPPLNYVGDFGGGSMFLVFGIMCALHEARTSGRGQVVDAAMVEGAAALSVTNYALRAQGAWDGRRGTHLLSGAAPFYDVYECADGKWVSVACNEPEFYAILRNALGLRDPLWDDQYDTDRWPERKELLRSIFRSEPRSHWCDLLEHTDACFAPVLSIDEVANHPHNAARGTFVEHFGVLQP
ncbi:MAG: CoA transferase, partial [Hyphomicrobiales bacterium]